MPVLSYWLGVATVFSYKKRKHEHKAMRLNKVKINSV